MCCVACERSLLCVCGLCLARFGCRTNPSVCFVAWAARTFSQRILICAVLIADCVCAFCAATNVHAVSTDLQPHIIALTANNFADDKQRCLDAGMNNCERARCRCSALPWPRGWCPSACLRGAAMLVVYCSPLALEDRP